VRSFIERYRFSVNLLGHFARPSMNWRALVFMHLISCQHSLLLNEMWKTGASPLRQVYNYLEKVHHHWEGQGNVTGLKADQYLVATILDPYTSPSSADLPPDWLECCSAVFSRFYKGQNLNMAETEMTIWLWVKDIGESVCPKYMNVGIDCHLTQQVITKSQAITLMLCVLQDKKCLKYALILFGRIHCRKSSHCFMKWQDECL